MDGNMKDKSSIKDYADVRVKLSKLRLKQLREDQELSLRDMAKKLKRSPTTVMNYESGNRTPTLEYLTQVADVFGISFEWLTGGHADINRVKLDDLCDNFGEEEIKELYQYALYLKERRRYKDES